MDVGIIWQRLHTAMVRPANTLATNVKLESPHKDTDYRETQQMEILDLKKKK